MSTEKPSLNWSPEGTPAEAVAMLRCLGEEYPLHETSAAATTVRDVRTQVEFIGETAAAMAYAATHPRSVRWKEVWHICERVGVDALPIVALISFLMGMILAFQSAVPMKRFGAEIFVADLKEIVAAHERGELRRELRGDGLAVEALLQIRKTAGGRRRAHQEFAVDSGLEIHRFEPVRDCLLYTSPSPRDRTISRMPSSA